jgi:CBS domain containing-hemolysin-like protein
MELLVLLFIVVILTSFLCSILESILLSTNITYISVLEKEHPKAGKLLKKLKVDIDKSIASILILNTTANTLGATAIGIQAKNVFGGDGTEILVISIILTFLILFLSEIIPKTIGAVYWRKLAVYTPRIINIFIFLTYPIIILTQFVTNKIGKETHDKISREELLQSTLLSEEEGVIGNLESQVIENTLALYNKKLKDILTPRSVMYAVEKNSVIKDIIEDKRTMKFSRIPVYEGTVDNIVGIILTKKLFKHAIKEKDIALEDLMKPVFTLHENIHVIKALKLFIQKKEHMFIVHDSYNQTEGIVTLEDCIETLLGLEIMDESDTTADMRKLALNKMKAKRKEETKEIL